MHHLTFDFYRRLLLFFSPARMKEKTGTKKENSKGANGTKGCQLHRVYFSWGFNFWGRVRLDFNWNNATRTTVIRINSWPLITEGSVARAAELMIGLHHWFVINIDHRCSTSDMLNEFTRSVRCSTNTIIKHRSA